MEGCCTSGLAGSDAKVAAQVAATPRAAGGQQPQAAAPGSGHGRVGSISNLEAFFAYSAPVVPTFLPGRKASPFLYLRDIWASMNEWSAYGVEVPLRLPGEVAEVVQCYVPQLSAIQIYDAAAHRLGAPGCCARGGGYNSSDEDLLSDGYCSSLLSDSGSSDDGRCRFCGCGNTTDSDSEDGGSAGAGGRPGCCCRAVAEGVAGSSLLRKAGSLGGEPGRGSLLFEFFETVSPHAREPLTERVGQLSAGFPGLNTLRSSDVHPASWFAVAWYPLYRLPASGRSIRDLNASFLTFHSLVPPLSPPPAAGPPEGGAKQQQPGRGSPPEAERCPLPPAPSAAAAAVYERRRAEAAEAGGGQGAAVLQPFAFAPYKMYGRTWDEERRGSKLQLQMLAAAGAWVRRRGTSVPDLDFFLSNLRPH